MLLLDCVINWFCNIIIIIIIITRYALYFKIFSFCLYHSGMHPQYNKIDPFIPVSNLYKFMNTLSIRSVIALGVMTMAVILPSVIYPVFAVSEKINVNLIVDTTTLKFTDVNNNQQPDPGEFAVVVGKLYTPGTTQNEIGMYRCSFAWGSWANSTEGIPVTPGLQIFDMKGNGTIVVVGDEPTTGAIGKQVVGAIAGGTGDLRGISGMATLTAKPMEGTNWPIEVVLDIERPAAVAS
jgi:hypothetical protein